MGVKNSSGRGARRDDRDDIVDINIVPLVDVLLVLLVVFMIAAPLSISGISVLLPESKAKGLSINEKHLILTIDKDGNYYIEKSQIQAANLEAKLRAIFEVRQQRELYIRADQNVILAKVVDAMSAGKLAGADKISMLKTARNNKQKAQ